MNPPEEAPLTEQKQIHPDDVLLFSQVAAAMREVARRYGLPLGKIVHRPVQKYRGRDTLGLCHLATGDIEIVIRIKENGRWTDGRLSTEEIWDTAAHELAHLRHGQHHEPFWQLCDELKHAMTTEKKDDKDKLIDRVIKLQRSAEGEAAMGNAEAAQAFAAMVNKYLVDNELAMSDVERKVEDPVIEKMVDMSRFGIKYSKARVGWQESLARIVARANLCTFLLRPGTNEIWFVGTKSHVDVAEYMFGTLTPAISVMSDKEAYFYKLKCNREKRPQEAKGFREAWQRSFLRRLEERLEQAKDEAIAQAQRTGGMEKSTAMVLLNSALMKVHAHIDAKFKGKKGAGRLNQRYSFNAAGERAGREAADRLEIGRKGVGTGDTVKGVLR